MIILDDNNDFKVKTVLTSMIVVDIETSGLDFTKCGIWQIGALYIDNPKNTFLEEARIDDNDLIEPEALRVGGKTESDLRDGKKQSQKQLLINFFSWVKKTNNFAMLSHNPQDLDYTLVVKKAKQYSLEFPFHHRCFDMHSMAQLKFFQVNGNFLMKPGMGVSEMGLSHVLEFCGMEDNRIKAGQKGVNEGHPHNALEDCRLTAECFSRIVFGKSLIEDYSKFLIPSYLKK